MAPRSVILPTERRESISSHPAELQRGCYSHVRRQFCLSPGPCVLSNLTRELLLSSAFGRRGHRGTEKLPHHATRKGGPGLTPGSMAPGGHVSVVNGKHTRQTRTGSSALRSPASSGQPCAGSYCSHFPNSFKTRPKSALQK